MKIARAGCRRRGLFYQIYRKAAHLLMNAGVDGRKGVSRLPPWPVAVYPKASTPDRKPLASMTADGAYPPRQTRSHAPYEAP